MKLSRFLLLISLATFFVLLYVYQQSEIFRMGYISHKKQEVFQELLDKNTVLRYNIQQKSSLTRIGNKVSRYEDFEMPDTFRLVKLRYPQNNRGGIEQGIKTKNFISRLLSVKTEAQAKTINP